MRHRIEDLGRLSVLIQVLLEHDLFNKALLPSRSKDYPIWFSEMSEDEKDETVRFFVYGIEEAREQLCCMLEIAEGEDALNESVEE